MMIDIMENRGFVKIVALILLATFITGTAEIITLRDGSKITGTITSQTDTEVVVKTSYGTLRIDKGNILNIDFGAGTSQPSQQPTRPEAQIIIQQQQQQQQQEQQQRGEQLGQYDRGFQDGRTKGYQDGYQKGKSEQKSQRITGALVGWLVWVGVVVAIVAASSSPY